MRAARRAARTLRRLRATLAEPGDDSTAHGRAHLRHRRAALAIAGGVAARASSVAGLFVSIRLVSAATDRDHLGLWLLLVSAVNLVGFSDLGIGNGLLTVVARALGTGDRTTAREAVSSAVAVLTVVAAVLGAGFATVYRVVPWDRLLNAGSAGRAAGPSVAVLVGSVLVSLPLGVAQRVHMSMQRGWVAAAWITAGNVASLVAVWVASATRASVPVLLAAALSGQVAAGAASTAVLVLRRGALRPRLGAARARMGLLLLRHGTMFFLLASAVAVGYESDSLVISNRLGADAVSLYAVPFRMFMVAPLLVGLVAGPLWPAYGEAAARGDLAWIRRTFRRSLAVALVATGIPSLLLLPIAAPISNRWFGAGRPPMLLLLGLGAWAVVNGVSAAVGVFFNGVGVLRFQVVAASVMAVTNLAGSIALVGRIGVAGPVIASVVSQVACVLVPSAVLMRRALRPGAPDSAFAAWLGRWARPTTVSRAA
ncbi:MAG: lipopolysaccharide biosynthesis protein [Actinobacteria bacterium]|nr:lipopolysaccharide biosynthesis protein [Actinomycetota bacterium]